MLKGKKKLLYKLRCFKRVFRPVKRREILVKHAYNNTIIFYICLISPISCVRLINEWQSDDRSQSRVAYRDFLELWLLKKKSVCLTDNVTFHGAEVKQNTKRKTESQVLDLGNGISRG